MTNLRWRRSVPWFGLLAVSLGVIAGGGCQSVHWKKADMTPKSSPFTKKGKDVAVTPARLSVIWTPSVLQQVGQSPKSGFGGQVYFFDQENRPVQVDGEFVVYGFDESNSRKSQQADHKYVFSKERLSEHYSETPVGPAYSFWIPWQSADEPRKEVALLPVFKAADGSIIKGDQAMTVVQGTNPVRAEGRDLAGRNHANANLSRVVVSPSPALTSTHPPTRTAPTTENRSADTESQPKRQMRTTTIDFSRSDRALTPPESINGFPFGVIATETTIRAPLATGTDGSGLGAGTPR